MQNHYFSYQPDFSGSIEEEMKQCLRKANDTYRSGLLPLRFEIFADLPDFGSVRPMREVAISTVRELFGNICPALNITAHPPKKPSGVVIEACFSDPSSEVTYNKYGEIHYTVRATGSYREVWVAGISSFAHPGNTRVAATEAFEILVGLLASEHLTLNDIIRQWNYIGNILQVNNGLQNYQVFNEVRSEYYHKYRTLKSYPAATGVGMKHGGVILDCIAASSPEGIEIKAVDNPNQVNAYNYSQQVLKGETEKGKVQKHPPQFERALMAGNGKHTTLFVSGTASIIGQETIGKGDTSEQTIVTIGNINKLAEPGHLCLTLGCEGECSVSYSTARIYVKKQEDFEESVKIFANHFPGVPATFIEADICRDDLLIEIEAEAAVSR